MKEGPPTKVFFYVTNYVFLGRFLKEILNLKRHFLKDVYKCLNFKGQNVGCNGR